MSAAYAPSSVRYRVAAASVLMAVMLYLDRICLGEIVKSESFLQETQFTEKQIGQLLSAFFFSYAIFQVPSGWLSDRFGARRMLTGYIALWSALTALTGSLASFSGMVLSRQACGLAQAGAYPTSTAVIRHWYALDARGKANAWITLGGRIGGAIAPALTAILILKLGNWRDVLWAYGLCGAVVAALYWAVIRDRPAQHPRCNAQEREIIGPALHETPPRLADVLPMLRGCLTSGSIWLHSAGQFLVNVGWVFLVAWLPTYLTKELHVEPQRGAWMVTFVLAAGIFGQFAGGIAADWSVRRFGLRWGRMLPRAISAWIGGLAFGCCLLSNHPWALVACCAVVSFMTDLGTPCGASFVQDVGGRNTASIFGWGNMWGNLGAGASALLTPWLMQQGKTLELGASLAFLVYAGSFVLCGFLALGMDPRRMIVPPENELSTASPITAPPKASAAPALE